MTVDFKTIKGAPISGKKTQNGIQWKAKNVTVLEQEGARSSKASLKTIIKRTDGTKDIVPAGTIPTGIAKISKSYILKKDTNLPTEKYKESETKKNNPKINEKRNFSISFKDLQIKPKVKEKRTFQIKTNKTHETGKTPKTNKTQETKKELKTNKIQETKKEPKTNKTQGIIKIPPKLNYFIEKHKKYVDNRNKEAQYRNLSRPSLPSPNNINAKNGTIKEYRNLAR